MDHYITGTTIRRLRENHGLTQAQLAERIGVSSKTVSKWETAKGLPDITLLEPLAEALGVSVAELLSGNPVTNRNKSSNVLRSTFYVCPVCGNVIRAMGDAAITCCGILLPPLAAEAPDAHHTLSLEQVEDETFVTVQHPMTKDHYISFIAHLTMDRAQVVKFYPEGNAETRLSLRGGGYLYIYCNRHGLMRLKV
ncbi:MAG: helix-turn-helix domain-containing protein [Clostridia bacterium]|nr:helix-turn-helix domain-containing protein [Clostridia bacterium]